MKKTFPNRIQTDGIKYQTTDKSNKVFVWREIYNQICIVNKFSFCWENWFTWDFFQTGSDSIGLQEKHRNLSLTSNSLAPKSAAISHSIKRKAVTTWCNSVPTYTPPHYRVICKRNYTLCANRPANKNEKKKYKININATALLLMLQVFLLFIPLSLCQQLEYIKIKLI